MNRIELRPLLKKSKKQYNNKKRVNNHVKSKNKRKKIPNHLTRKIAKESKGKKIISIKNNQNHGTK